MSLPEISEEGCIKIWSKAVDTQMHFNEMSVRSRQLGLTFVAAALGIGIVLISRGKDFSLSVGGVDLHVSVLIVIGAALALNAVRVLDLNVYHKMLRGAVTFGEDFEENYIKKRVHLDKCMTQAISHFSRYADASVSQKKDGTYRYCGKEKVTARDKINSFYNIATFSLLGIAVVIFFLTSGLF